MMAPGHVDLRDEDPSLCGVFDLFEPDWPDRAAGIEDGDNTDFPRQFFVLARSTWLGLPQH